MGAASKCSDETDGLMNGINGRSPGQRRHVRRFDLSHLNLQRVYWHRDSSVCTYILFIPNTCSFISSLKKEV